MTKPFNIENPQALTDALNGLDVIASEPVLRQAAVAGARVIFDEVKIRVPVRSGVGYEAIVIAYDKDVSVPGRVASYLVTWVKKAWYLRLVEYGTSKMAAKPFLRPSYEAKKQDAADAVMQVIDKKVSEVGNV